MSKLDILKIIIGLPLMMAFVWLFAVGVMI